MVPLIVLSATLVVLVIAIVVVVLVGKDDARTPLAAPTGAAGGPLTPSPSASIDSDLDECLIGRWRVTSHREDVPISNVGPVKFTGGQGATVEILAEGTGTTDYGSGTEYTGSANGQTIRLVISGAVTYRVTTRLRTVSFSGLQSTARARIFLNGTQFGSEAPFAGSDDPTTYECAGSSLVQETVLMKVQLSKL